MVDRQKEKSPQEIYSFPWQVSITERIEIVAQEIAKGERDGEKTQKTNRRVIEKGLKNEQTTIKDESIG